ncbi:MAG: glycosyltransferase family 2 protein [Burkholderiales bacterium]|nr:glycosyltransferase family 2 protein [Burkholderiales bacterium]
MNLPLPRVSVLMAVFNTASYLQEALTSISGQSFADFELIVVDDGSNDGSTQILRAFAATEPRMRLIVRENRGLISTRNELLQAANGELIAWMDSDDYSSTNRLALQVARFDAEPDLVCLGGFAQCIDPNGEYLNVERYPLEHQEILAEQQKGGAMRFPTTMMRRDAALRAGGFREPFRIGEDFDLFLRLSEAGQMANLPGVIYFYRQHLSSVCSTLGPRWTIYRDAILELAQERKTSGSDKLQRGEGLDIAATPLMNMRPFEARTYLRWANEALQNGNTSLAWKYTVASLAKQPMSREGWKTAARCLLPQLRKPM